MTITAPERAPVGYGLDANEGEAFWLLGMLETIKISGEDTGGQFGLLEIVVRAGDGSPWHVHPDEDEWFYVIQGEYLLEVGSQRHRLKSGDSILGPREIPHAWAIHPAN